MPSALPPFHQDTHAHLRTQGTGRPHRQPHRARVDAVKVHQPLKCGLERRGVVVTDGLQRTARLKRRRRKTRLKKAGNPKQQGLRGAAFIQGFTCAPWRCDQRSRSTRRHQVPELPQTRHPGRRRVAGDQGRVDGTDGNSRHPGGRAVALGEGLEHPGLVGTQRAAALEHQNTFPVGHGRS